MSKENSEVNANREYKDSVFTKLFSDKEKLAELYNAIAETNYTADDITLATLENIIFIGRENDIAFVADDKLIVLIEHQSTINPNMPLRCLLYVAREYDILADGEAIYSSRLIKIMPPEFIVMYNGVDEYPDESELRLSDAFMDKTDSLELKVKVYNVNEGRNPDIMRRSKTLKDYATFVAKARENVASGLELAKALEKAVKDCIDNNVLKEFLEIYGGDVMSMFGREFNMDDALRVRYKDGEQNKAEKVAEKLLKRGMSIEDVAEDAELSIERVEQIAKKIAAEQYKAGGRLSADGLKDRNPT